MADKRQDDPKYNNVTGRIGGSLGRDEKGRSAYSIYTGRAASNIFFGAEGVGDALLGTIFVGIGGSVILGLGSAAYTELTDPTDIPFDTQITENFNQNYGYNVSQEMDTSLALIQNDGQFEIYRIDHNAQQHRIYEPEGETVDRWDFIESPLRAELYARDIADSYTNALELAERNPEANLDEFAPVSYSYDVISQPYLEENGEPYRDSRGLASNDISGSLSLDWLQAQETLWNNAADQIAQGAYAQDLGENLRMTVENDKSKRGFDAFFTAWQVLGAGWIALSLMSAGLYTRQRVSNGRRSRNGRSPS